MNEQNLVQIQKKYTSRSAVLTYKTCHYKRYLAYELESFGFVPEQQSLDLLNGSTIHKGLRHLFEHCRIEHQDGNFNEGCIDEAVEVAREFWLDCLAERPLRLKSSDEYNRLDWIIAEQECLWEGLIRAFAIHKLSGILDEYEILEVEKEEVFEGFSPIVTFLGAADGLFLRKRDQKLIVLSIKSTSQFADVTERDILHDMQGVSESFLVQERLNRTFKEYKSLVCAGSNSKQEAEEKLDAIRKLISNNDNMQNYFWSCYSNNIDPKVFAVQYEYLIKGQRRQDPYKSGEYRQQSFLCHPLKLESINRLGFGIGGGIISANPAEYKWQWGSGKQPKGWLKEDIWNDIGIKNWIELLASNQVQPQLGSPFEQILRTPDLVVRSEREIEEWLISTRFQEEEIVKHLEEIKNNLDYSKLVDMVTEEAFLREAKKLVWQYFDKNTQSCHNYYGSDCNYIQHCHEFESIEDLITAGYLIPRISHHEAEKLEQIQRGFIEDE